MKQHLVNANLASPEDFIEKMINGEKFYNKTGNVSYWWDEDGCSFYIKTNSTTAPCTRFDLYTEIYQYKEVEWWEDIPEQGVLCWVWGNGDNLEYVKHAGQVAVIRKMSDSKYAENQGFWHNAQPLTKEEALALVYNRGEE